MEINKQPMRTLLIKYRNCNRFHKYAIYPANKRYPVIANYIPRLHILCVSRKQGISLTVNVMIKVVSLCAIISTNQKTFLQTAGNPIFVFTVMVRVQKELKKSLDSKIIKPSEQSWLGQNLIF